MEERRYLLSSQEIPTTFMPLRDTSYHFPPLLIQLYTIFWELARKTYSTLYPLNIHILSTKHKKYTRKPPSRCMTVSDICFLIQNSLPYKKHLLYSFQFLLVFTTFLFELFQRILSFFLTFFIFSVRLLPAYIVTVFLFITGFFLASAISGCARKEISIAIRQIHTIGFFITTPRFYFS